MVTLNPLIDDKMPLVASKAQTRPLFQARIERARNVVTLEIDKPLARRLGDVKLEFVERAEIQPLYEPGIVNLRYGHTPGIGLRLEISCQLSDRFQRIPSKSKASPLVAGSVTFVCKAARIIVVLRSPTVDAGPPKADDSKAASACRTAPELSPAKAR